MSIQDYAVLVALYMVVSLQGKNILKNFKLQRGSTQDALAHGIVFIGLLYLVGILSRRVAMYSDYYIERCRPDETGQIKPVFGNKKYCEKWFEKYKEKDAAAAAAAAAAQSKANRNKGFGVAEGGF